MCEFCDCLKESKKMHWFTRSTFADDNICEYIGGIDCCDKCKRCIMDFTIEPYKIDKDIYISLDYEQRLHDDNNNEVIVHPFTEGLMIAYCPICGKKISKSDSNKIDYAIEIVKE